MLGLPGGKVDPFELVVDAAAREIQEELGIIIMPTVLLCVVDRVDRAGRQHWIAPVFRIEQFEGTPAIMEHALSDLGWFKLDALPSPLTEATKQAVAAMSQPTIAQPSCFDNPVQVQACLMQLFDSFELFQAHVASADPNHPSMFV